VAWPVSATFLDTVTRSHKRASRVDVLVEGDVVGTLGTLQDGSTYGGVIGGTVEISRAPVRRRLSGLVVVDPERRYVRTTDQGGIAWLSPYGVELRVWRGIDYQDGSDPELVPLGTFEITANAEDQPKVDVSGWDRGGTINQFKFISPFEITLGENLTAAIKRVVETRWPGQTLTYNMADAGWTTPGIVLAEQAEPWTEACKRLAAAGGYDLHFDPMGDVVMRSEPVVNDSIIPVVSFHAGTDGVRIGAPQQARSTEGHYNGIILSGENTDNVADGTGVIRVEVWDENSRSPTYVGGPWGYRARWVPMASVKTPEQAYAAATGILRAELGRTDGYTITCLPMPHLDVNDAARVFPDRGDDVTGTNLIQLIDTISVPVAGGSMRVDTRGALPLDDFEEG
jgi:hypothetical protein